jgi:hypothetical protein
MCDSVRLLYSSSSLFIYPGRGCITLRRDRLCLCRVRRSHSLCGARARAARVCARARARSALCVPPVLCAANWRPVVAVRAHVREVLRHTLSCVRIAVMYALY